VEFEPSGQFRKQDWFANCEGLIVISEKGDKPPLAETYRSALEWALQPASALPIVPTDESHR
jgi:hypothetical protein